MAGRSSAPTRRAAERPPETPGFGRSRVALGIALVGALAAVVLVLAGRAGGPPDPGRLVYVSETADAVVARDLATGAEREVAPWPAGAERPSLDPAGERLAYRAPDGEVRVVDLATADVADLGRPGLPLGWTPVGELLLAREDGGDRTILARGDDGEERRLWGPVEGEIEEVLWGGGHAAIALRTPQTGEPELLLLAIVGDEAVERASQAGSRPLVGSSNGRQLLYARPDEGWLGLLHTRDLGSEEIARGAAFTAGRLGPGGLVGLRGSDRDGPGIWIFSPSTLELREATRADAGALAWSADGSDLLYTEDGAIRALAVGAEDDPRTIARGARAGFLEVTTAL